MKKTKEEFEAHYGNYMTKKKLYRETCIRLHNDIIGIEILYEQFRDSDASNFIIENIEMAKVLLESVNERVKQNG